MDDIDTIALLQDAMRRRLYEYVAAQGREVARNEAAEAVGVGRTLAAFHLDKLAEAGLLEVASRRLTGRSGPGAGRPAKVYRRAAAERGVSVPPRDYRTVAGLLAEVADAAGLDMEAQDAARRLGRTLRGAGGSCGDLDAVREVLAARGYEPVVEGEGAEAVLRMRNCPFHVVAERFPPLVCGMNLAMMEGLVEGSEGVGVRMDPRPGWCCVAADHSKNNRD
ncbi:helix-turn-helix transcriptional regulator [Actinomadura litoris]|uniref:Transcriptional regulator n=1 Tax=Actinomadura litoris TaxID=2678616 RepID=A0A7K1KZW0_9ACTN|nr:helix-turn-helix domain-containing protein [Actinomadura litoris]MUN37669.1 transcriptional regulator [Actinomadura litoris]